MKIRTLDQDESQNTFTMFADEQGDIYIRTDIIDADDPLPERGGTPCIVRIGGVHSGHQIPGRIRRLLTELASEFKKYEHCQWELDAANTEQKVNTVCPKANVVWHKASEAKPVEETTVVVSLDGGYMYTGDYTESDNKIAGRFYLYDSMEWAYMSDLMPKRI